MTVTASMLAAASQATYSNSVTLPSALQSEGFVSYQSANNNGYFTDSDTGFGAQVWHNAMTGEYIVALRGTDFSSPQDWYTNVQLGKPQFNSVVAQQLKDIIGDFVNPTKIHFTGHSLGGALAQYFANEFANTSDAIDIGLTTFNSLGSKALFDTDPFIDERSAQLPDIEAVHYVIPGDAVSRLGNGHLGGNVRELNITDTRSPLEAHAMDIFLDLPDSAFTNSTEITNPNYLSIDTAQAIASAMSVSTEVGLLADDGKFSNTEASARLVAGLIPALLEAPAGEINQIVEAFFPDSVITQSLVAAVLEIRPIIEQFPQFERGQVAARGIAAALFLTTQKLNDLGISNSEIDGFVSEAASLFDSLNELALAITPADEIFDTVLEQASRFYQFVYGEENNDQFVLGRLNFDDVIDGDSGRDEFYGGSGDDTLRGYGGDDYLYGNEGADELRGGEGNDYLSGGADTQSDKYYYNTGDGHDTVIDADLGGDRIIVNGTDLSTLDFVQIAEGSNTYRVEDQDISLLKGTVDTTIFIGTGDDQGSITLNAYSDGGFGINVQEADEFEEPASPSGARDLEALGERNRNSGTGGVYEANFFDRVPNENDKPLIYNGDDYWVGNTISFVSYEFSGTFLGDRLIGIDDIVGDHIYALDGDDYIDGRAGTDILEGNAGSDTIFGGDDTDFIYGDSHRRPAVIRDFLGVDHDINEESEGATNYMDGEGGDDYLIGGKYEDIINGSEGKDFLAGYAGNDILSGGSEEDWIFGDSFLTYEFIDEPIGPVGNREFEVAVDVEYITSSESNLEYDDFIDGGDGNDVIFGEVGDDIIHGGKGEDTIWGDRSVDDADGELAASLNGKDTIYGGENDDDIYGGGNDDLLHGGSGNDVIFGDGETIEESAQGNDIIYGGTGNDELQGGAGDDRLSGDAGTDTLFGQKGKDTLFGGEGNDELSGGEEDDELWGEAGNDLLIGGQGNDRVYGGIGNDELQGNDGNDILVAGSGSDILFGQDGDDRLDGGTGDDSLQGNGGDDTLKGGGGSDFLEGGSGNDTYVFALGDGGASIDDTSGASTLHFDGVASLTQLRLVQSDTHTTVYYSDDNSDWVTMDNASFAYVTHIELGAARFDRGQLFEATSIRQTGSAKDQLDMGAIDFSPADIQILSRNNGLQFRARSTSGGPGSTTYGDIEGIKGFFGDWSQNIGDVSFTDLEGNYVTPDDATNVELPNWYILDPNDKPNIAALVNGGAIPLSQLSENRSFDGQPIIFGNEFNNQLAGGGGDEELVGRAGDDVLVGFGGDDRLFGDEGHDRLEGGSGRDRLEGDGGNDTLFGDGDTDWLYGGSGDDILWGGSGGGTMDGGEGNDTFIVDASFSGYLGISDFDGDDTLIFRDIDFNEVYFERQFNHLNVWVGEERLVISDAFRSFSPSEIEEWAFADGGVYAWDELQQAFDSNLAPLVNIDIDDVNLDVDDDYSFTLQANQFTDPDGVDPLRYSFGGSQLSFTTNVPFPSGDEGEEGEGGIIFSGAQGLGEWFTVDFSTGDMVGDPRLIIDEANNRIIQSDIGHYFIGYRASDRFDGHRISRFELSVTDDNPAIDPRVGFDDIELEVGESLSFSLPYYDNVYFGNSQATVGVSLNRYEPERLSTVVNIDDFINGDDGWLTNGFEFDNIVADDPTELPDWLSYDAATQTFYGTPDVDDVDDSFVVHVWLSNGGETFAFEHSVSVSVIAEDSQLTNFSLGNDTIFALNEAPVTIDFEQLLSNDLHFSNEVLSLVGAESAGQGSLSIDFSGEQITYTPAGSEDFAQILYRVSDGARESSAVAEISFEDGYILSSQSDNYDGDKTQNFVLSVAGDDNLSGRRGDDLLVGGQGNDLIKGGMDDDRLFGELGNDVLKGGMGNDTLVGGSGDDLLRGGEGDDRYLFGLGFGSDTINNKSFDNNEFEDVIEFLDRIDENQLWFSRRNSHLIIDVIGTNDSVKIKNWYADERFKVDEVLTKDSVLIEQSVEQLVQAMAAFAPPAGVGAEIPSEIADVLAPQIAAAWVPRNLI